MFFSFFSCWCCPRKKEKSEVFHQTGVTKVVDVEEKVGRRPLKTCRAAAAAVATGGGGAGLAKANQKTRNSICFVSREVSGGGGGLKVFFKMALEAQALEKKKEGEIERGGGKGGV